MGRPVVLPSPRFTFLACLLMLGGCSDRISPRDARSLAADERLLVSDIEAIVSHGVEQAERLGQKDVLAVTSRDGTKLAVFRMTGAAAVSDAAVAKARTAAYLSSNQHGFTTLTACFITRSHFPPGVSNLPGGPLYGVGASSLPGGDIMPNGGGLSGAPGGVPIFKNGVLVGGLGVAGGSDASSFDRDKCGGQLSDEIVALGATLGYGVPAALRGDGILIDGIRFLYANSAPPAGNFTLAFSSLVPDGHGTIDPPPLTDAGDSIFPAEGEVNLTAFSGHDFSIHGGSIAKADVERIIEQARVQAAKTRAAIRRPIGVPAQVFISVVGTDGSVLGIWRTPDATLFSFDVSAQKARTALAFSDPGHALGKRIRRELGLPETQPVSFSTRAVGFLSQDYYPPGIDEETLGRPVQAGPLFGIQDSLGLDPFGNGVTIFPGGLPLYQDGALVGAIGISGDGVDQDDLICSAGTRGFEAPEDLRCDRLEYRDVRLPYVKFPRQPEIKP